jgi:hypothetical protein
MKYSFLILSIALGAFTGCKKESTAPAAPASCTLAQVPTPTQNAACNIDSGSTSACLIYDDTSLIAIAKTGSIGNCYLAPGENTSPNPPTSVIEVSNGCMAKVQGYPTPERDVPYYFFINQQYISAISGVGPNGYDPTVVITNSAAVLKNSIASGKCGFKN